jgi:hypothetical protein
MGAGILCEGGEVDVWGDFDGGSSRGRFGGGSSKEYALDLCFKGHEIATPLEGVMGAGTGVSGEGGEGGPSIGRFSVSEGDLGGESSKEHHISLCFKGHEIATPLEGVMGPGLVRRVRGRGGGRVWGDSQFQRAIWGGMDAAASHKPMFQTA